MIMQIVAERVDQIDGIVSCFLVGMTREQN